MLALLDPGVVVVKRMRAQRDKRGLSRMGIWCLLRFGGDAEIDLDIAQVEELLEELVGDGFLVRTTPGGGASMYRLARWRGMR